MQDIIRNRHKLYERGSHKSLGNQGHEAACDVEHGFQLSTLSCGDCGSFFCCDHAEKVLAELTVKNQYVKDGVHPSGEDKTCECAQVQENIGEGIEHLSEVADLIVLACEVSVKVVGDFSERKKWNQHADCDYGNYGAVLAFEPARQKV